MNENPGAIVVTGIGVISPYGTGLEKLEAGLLAGRSRLEPCSDFYAGFEGSVAQVENLGLLEDVRLEDLPRFRPSRTDRLAVLAARDAVAASGAGDLIRSECGVVMASTVAGLSEIDLDAVQDRAAWYRAGGVAKAASYPVAHVADAVGEYLGVRGPRCAVTVACASGAISIALAANMLRDGAASTVLAGGADALCAFTLSGFSLPCKLWTEARAGRSTRAARVSTWAKALRCWCWKRYGARRRSRLRC